jgi:hypothetical protein
VRNNKTAQLKVENLVQTSFRLSPTSLTVSMDLPESCSRLSNDSCRAKLRFQLLLQNPLADSRSCQAAAAGWLPAQS